MRLFSKSAAILGLTLLPIFGCGDASTDNESSASNADVPAQSSPVTELEEKPEPATPEVSLRVLDASETDDLIASHKGKIVVVDLWALW